MELTTRCAPIQAKPKNSDIPDTFPKGRICSAPGCKHKLSVFNVGPRCHSCIHTGLEGKKVGSHDVVTLMESMP